MAKVFSRAHKYNTIHPRANKHRGENQLGEKITSQASIASSPKKILIKLNKKIRRIDRKQVSM